MIKSIVIILLLTSQFCFGQIVVKGTVKNKKNLQPIAYANIGIINTSIGTISNSDGSFEIRVPSELHSKSIIFSAIGYEKVELPIPKTSQLNLKITLEEKSTILKNVEIKARSRISKKWLGNSKKAIFPKCVMNYDSATAGAAMALLVTKKDSTLDFVQEARLLILRNTLPEFKIRLRFLQIDSSNHNLPGKDLINENMIVSSTIKKGWLNFDLREKGIYIDQDKFYLVFEWLLEESDRYYIANSYSDFMKNHPDEVKRDTVMIDNIAIPTVDVGDYLIGTFFGISTSKSARDKMVTYTKKSSFANWVRAPSILRAQVLMSD